MFSKDIENEDLSFGKFTISIEVLEIKEKVLKLNLQVWENNVELPINNPVSIINPPSFVEDWEEGEDSILSGNQDIEKRVTRNPVRILRYILSKILTKRAKTLSPKDELKNQQKNARLENVPQDKLEHLENLSTGR